MILISYTEKKDSLFESINVTFISFPSCLRLPWLRILWSFRLPLTYRRPWWLRRRRFDACHERRNVQEVGIHWKLQHTLGGLGPWWQWRHLRIWRRLGSLRELVQNVCRSFVWVLRICMQYGQYGNRVLGCTCCGSHLDGWGQWPKRWRIWFPWLGLLCCWKQHVHDGHPWRRCS